jgi:hypothetical protein
MSARRKKDLLKQLKVLTPSALVRWDCLAAIINILIIRLKEETNYGRAWVRPWELKEYEVKSVTAHNLIGTFCKLDVLQPLDKRIKRIVPPEVQISKNGITIIRGEIDLWNEVFRLTRGYILDRLAIQVLRERLDELDRLINGSNKKQAEC